MVRIDMSRFQELSSGQNPIIKKIRTLQLPGVKASRLRGEDNLALIDGIHLIKSWLDAKSQRTHLKSIFTTQKGLENSEVADLVVNLIKFSESNDINFYLVDEKLWRGLSDLELAPRLMALVNIPEQMLLPDGVFDCVILDGIQDSGNVGNILRTAVASGFNNVICLKGTAQVWSPKVLRSAMGAHTALNVWEGIGISECISKIKAPLLTTQLDVKASLYDLKNDLLTPVAWIFGNEGAGVSSQLKDVSRSVYIPQEKDVESLNVSAAAAICLFETRRVRLEHKISS